MKKILFVCVENSCRSQMAEAFVNIHGGRNVKAFSSGSRPSGVVNPKAIASMREIGYDLSLHKSIGLDEIKMYIKNYRCTNCWKTYTLPHDTCECGCEAKGTLKPILRDVMLTEFMDD